MLKVFLMKLVSTTLCSRHDAYITGVCLRIICMSGHLPAYDKVNLGAVFISML